MNNSETNEAALAEWNRILEDADRSYQKELARAAWEISEEP